MKKHGLGKEKNEKMLEIITNLKQRMKEIDKIGEKIKQGPSMSPKRTKHMLEELKVPSLRLLKEAR